MSLPQVATEPREDAIELREAEGGRRLLGLSAFLGLLESARAGAQPCFSPSRMDLVARVSEQILRSGAQGAGPGVVHFAYWTRRAALKRLASQYEGRLPEGCIARPRGLVFHLPPQNVETVFLYSWVISYLLGNANVTRLPTTLSDEMARLLGMFQAALHELGDTSQLFVRYPAQDELNRAISAVSDARLVWGGDAKVRSFAPLPLRNGGKAVWFGDRQSAAMVDGAALAALTAGERKDLAARLHNDIFVFDQMACSSPQRLFVRGTEAEHGAAVLSLMRELSDAAEERGSTPATGHAIRKMVASFAAAARGEARTVVRHSNALTTMEADEAVGASPVGGGFLTVVYRPDLDAISGSLEEHIQTMVHFGFTPEELQAFAGGLSPFAVARVAPVGQALDFDVVWDGYDLCAELTRLLRVA